MSIGFNLKSPAESDQTDTNRRVSLSFEALKPGNDFSSPAMIVLVDNIFFQFILAVSSTLKNLLFSVATFIKNLS